MQQARQHYVTGRTVSPVRPSGQPYRRQDPHRKIKKFRLLTIFTFSFLLCLVVVGQYSSLVILNYQLSAAREELAVVQSASRELELEVGRLSTIGRIDQIAREELGMVEPELNQLRILTANRNGPGRLGE